MAVKLYSFAATTENIKRIKIIPKNGGSRKNLPEELMLNCHKKHHGHSDTYGRMKWDEPSPTLTCKCNSLSNGRFGHPEQDRAISLRYAWTGSGKPIPLAMSFVKLAFFAVLSMILATPDPNCAATFCFGKS